MERLKEALERWSAGYETMRPPADETEALHDSHVRLILAAARAVLDGQEIRWCEIHESIARPTGITACDLERLRRIELPGTTSPCRMVVRLLVETPE